MTPPLAPIGVLRSVVVASALAWLPAVLAAETVTLSSPAGLEVTGRLVSHDGEFYRLETDAGVVTLAGSGMICTGAACPGDTALRLTIDARDRSLRRLAAALLRGFAAAQRWKAVETHDARGLVELSMEDAPGQPRLVVGFGPAPEAWQVLRDPGEAPPKGWRDSALGFDAVVAAVSVENPVTGLTLLAMRAALAGEFADWVGLGGGPEPVRVHWPLALGRPLTATFALAPGPDARRHADAADAADGVVRGAGGLGLLPLSEIGSAVPLVLTGSCGRGTLGVPAAVRTGDYPLSETVLLRRPGARPGPVARAFLEWLDSPDARAAVVLAGFVDLGVGVVPPGRDGRQDAEPLPPALGGSTGLAAVEAGLGEARRLDVAVRFRDGSSLPDRTARFQIERLAGAIAAGRFDGARLIFAGFSDASGAAVTNLELSHRRAEAIRAAVVASAEVSAAAVTLEARGFGEAMPVACNGVDWGESLNRRVEVWLANP